MGLTTESQNQPGGRNRDEKDFERLRHARERHDGFPVGKYLQPPPMLFTRDGHNIFLGDIYRGRTAFLVCGGPSLAQLDLAPLQERGMLTLAVNNAPALFRPNLWCCVDSPGNFIDAIWRDPAIWKFVPLCHMEKQFVVRDENEELVDSVERVGDMPAVFGFRRNEDFQPDQWLHEDTFNWGNHAQRADRDNYKGARSVMYIALRLLFYLGVRRIYLLGCDFRMTYGDQNYAFEQDRSRASVHNNNHSYEVLNVRLRRLLPRFRQEGLEVFNCTKGSGLTVFPFLSYADALQAVRETMPARINTAGMYDRARRLRPRKPESISSRMEGEPPAIARPYATLVVSVSPAALKMWKETWPTWVAKCPWLKELPLVIVHSTEALPDDAWRPDVERLESVAWDSKSGCLGWLRSVVHEVKTSWILYLDSAAIALPESRWPLRDWFEATPVETTPVLIGPSWGYSRPADILQHLDDWGDCEPCLQDAPRLNRLFEATEDRIRHAALGGWMMFMETAWIRSLADSMRVSPPTERLETCLLYCAERQQRRVVRLPMKSHGWDHSWQWKLSDVAARCQPILTANNQRPPRTS